MARTVSKTITAENQFTEWISPMSLLREGMKSGYLNLSITGNSTAIEISIQRTLDNGVSDIRDIPTSDFETYVYTVNTEQIIRDDQDGIKYRIGCKSGGYTSGTAEVSLGI